MNKLLVYRDGEWETVGTVTGFSWSVPERGSGRFADEAAGLVPLSKAQPAPRVLASFPAFALRSEPGTAPFIPFSESD